MSVQREGGPVTERLTVDAIRDCLEGAIPGVMATCALDGTPNVSYISQVHYIDASHVALSFQFFNKTRENVLANPRAAVWVMSPHTAARYRLALQYLRTETAGPLFESMKAHLAGIASHTGMSGVFKLQGSDVYRVLAIEQVPGAVMPPPMPRRNLLAALHAFAMRVAAATDLATLLDDALAGLESRFDIRHAMLLMADEPGRRLYTVASRGYETSGVGSEIPYGQGVIGVAATERTPIRITHMTMEYSYSRAIRESAQQSGYAGMLETEIPFPGLPEARSRLAVPIVAGAGLVGVLYVESLEDVRFGYDDEDALVAAAALVGLAVRNLQDTAEAHDDVPPASAGSAPVAGAPVTVRHYCADDSVFLGDDYLIKGVAGAIFWKLLSDYSRAERTEFTNRELRLDPSLRLPDFADNLEARLILLQRRLTERCPFLAIEKTGRGRFRFCVRRPVQLQEVPAPQGG
jgi:hypothetical protein